MAPNALIHQHQIQGDFVEFSPSAIEVANAALDRLVGDRLATRCGFDRVDAPLAEVLVNAAGFVQQSNGRFKAMNHVPALRLVEALVVDAGEAVDHADMSGLREKCVLVDETPDREQAVHAPSMLVVAKDALHAQHPRTSMSIRECFKAS